MKENGGGAGRIISERGGGGQPGRESKEGKTTAAARAALPSPAFVNDVLVVTYRKSMGVVWYLSTNFAKAAGETL